MQACAVQPDSVSQRKLCVRSAGHVVEAAVGSGAPSTAQHEHWQLSEPHGTLVTATDNAMSMRGRLPLWCGFWCPPRILRPEIAQIVLDRGPRARRT